MRNSKIGKIIVRIFITLLGVAFVFWGIATLTLGIIGEKTMAVVTDIRREGGERNEAIRGRYTYNISYTFQLPNGKRIDGLSKKIGSAVYLKADGKSKTAVRYLAAFPYINATEQDTKPGLGQVIIILAGLLLIYWPNRRESNERQL